jgi:hypothetical protein
LRSIPGLIGGAQPILIKQLRIDSTVCKIISTVTSGGSIKKYAKTTPMGHGLCNDFDDNRTYD